MGKTRREGRKRARERKTLVRLKGSLLLGAKRDRRPNWSWLYKIMQAYERTVCFEIKTARSENARHL